MRRMRSVTEGCRQQFDPVSLPTKIIFDAESYDRASEYSTTTGRFTATADGFYLVNVAVPVEDDGCGMTQKVLEEDWVQPATPIKRISKSSQDTTPKGRKIQGEKGIGRFAILKLGKAVSITTRPQNWQGEYVLKLARPLSLR